ncbi:MAG: hypothetical protein Q8M17_13515 [Actinomycetota bacterium]|nr:hypothetical protein [Actinomycetota bacterium]
MSRPVSITLAVILQWIGAVYVLILGFDLLAAGVGMTRTGIAAELEATLVEQGITDLSGSIVVVSMILAGALMCAIALVRMVVSAYLWQGREWSRMLLTVLIALNVIGALAYLVQGEWLRAVGAFVIDALMLYLMFNTQSSDFIAQAGRARRAEAAA